MGLWIFMLCMVWLTPVLMIVFGAVFRLSPPEDINSIYGYRTRKSMSGQQAWDFAQRYWGNCAVKTGLAVLLPAVPCMLPCMGKTDDFVGMWGSGVCVLAAAVVIGVPVFLTERKLKKSFG